MVPEVMSIKQFAEATGMNQKVIERKCANGDFRYAQKVGSKWYINFDKTLGSAAPDRTSTRLEDTIEQTVKLAVASQFERIFKAIRA